MCQVRNTNVKYLLKSIIIIVVIARSVPGRCIAG